MKQILLFIVLAVLSGLLFYKLSSPETPEASYVPLWSFQAVDTMKFSRDVSREKLNDSSFDITINNQIKNISAMGATHVGIATPYDEEFVPILKRWVNTARRHNLKIWYRGNWSGWEGWFGYPKIDRATHIKKTEEFILKHPELFHDGDVFSACPECENGGPGDPRLNGDTKGHRTFLIDEYEVTKAAFRKIGKDVATNYNSMNGDVARLVMDKETTKSLGGIVVIDHYVRTSEQLAKDIRDIAEASGGSVVLGEFGAPILDINGGMTEDEQAQWLRETMQLLITLPELKGLSYWVNVGGSTSLYNDDGSQRKAVRVLRSFYSPELREIHVTDPLGGAVQGIKAQTLMREHVGANGRVLVPVIEDGQTVMVSAEGYGKSAFILEKSSGTYTAVLEPVTQNLSYRLRKLLRFIIRI